MRSNETRETTVVILADLIQTWYDDRYFCTLHFDTSLTDHDLDSRSQREKAETSVPIISESFQSICMKFIPLLRLFDVMKLILILSIPFSLHGIQPFVCDFIKNTFVACIQTFTHKFLSILQRGLQGEVLRTALYNKLSWPHTS